MKNAVAGPQSVRLSMGAVLRRSTAIASVALAVASCMGGGASAQTWTGGAGNDDYNDTGNWSTNAVPTTGDTAVFNGTGATVQPTLGVPNSAAAWTISGGQSYSIGGAGTIDLSTGLTNTATVGQSVNLSIIGAGSVVQNGPGTLTLFSSGSTYGGDTVINAGTLRVFGGDAIGDTSAVSLANASGARLQVQQFEIVGALSGGGALGGGSEIAGGGGLRTNFDTITSTYAGSISGAGFLFKGGTGTLVLTGNNTYANGLGVADGTVIGNVAALPGDIFNSATVVFDQSTDATYAGNIDIVPGGANGQMVKRGAGALALSGTNILDWTLETGSLASDANRFTGNVAAAAGTSFILDQTAAGTYSNVISGLGGLEKTGAGTLTLSGVNTYTGDTVISNGMLITQSGAIADTSAVRVADTAGATWQVNGFETVGAISGGGASGGAIEIVGANFGDGLVTRFDDVQSTFAGTISGDGYIVKEGTGTLVLTGVNSYVGGIGVRGGTVIGNVAALPGDIFNSATVVFDQSSDATYAGNIDFVPGDPQTGQMIKRGAGSLILSGTNILDWTVDAGNLTSDANRFTGNISTAAGTSFTLDQSSAGIFSNVISGAGGFTKAGAGTLALSGVNTYTGTTTINAGTLDVRGGNAISDASSVMLADAAGARLLVTDSEAIGSLAGGGASGGNVEIASGAQLTAGAAGGDTTFAGALSGAGGFTKAGADTLTLSGVNTYTGTTTINAGTLDVRGGNAISDASAVVLADAAGAKLLVSDSEAIGSLAGGGANGGNVEIASGAQLSAGAAGGDTTFAGALSGAGGFTKAGAGSLTLSGTNTYTGTTTINAGTLDVRGGNAISDASAVVLADAVGARLLVTDSEVIGSLAGGGASGGNVEIAGGAQLDVGGVSGTTTFAGALSGAGSLSLDGSFTQLTGDSSGYLGTTQVASTLSVNGILGGRLTVLSGGRLQGNGTVGDTVLSSGATIAPGNSIGRLSVDGNLTFNAGSLYEVEVGGTGAGDRIDVSGTAALNDASVQVIALDPATSYRNGQAYTILTAGTIDGRFSPVIATDSAFINSSLTYGVNDVILNVQTALLTSAAASFNQSQTANALDSLSNAAGSPDLAFYNTLLDLDAAEARQVFDSLSGEVHASVQTGLIEESRHVRDAALSRLDAAFAAPTIASTTSGPNEGAAPLGLGAGAWISGYGSWGETDGNGNAGGLDRDVGGVLVGADVAIGETSRLGIFTGYSHSDFDIASRSSSADVDSYHLGIYGGTEIGAILLKAGAAYSWNDVETQRSVAFTGFSDALSADYDSGTAQVFGEASYRFDLAQGRIEPFVNLAYVNLDTDGFRENGGIAALRVSSEETDTTFSTVGLRASTALSISGMDVSANGMLGWRHAYDGAPTSTLAFASGNAFTVAGVPIGEDAAVVELGLGVAITPAANVSLRYNGQFGNDITENGVTARLSIDF